MGNAKYIGRVGGLAVALGIGVAICGSAGAAWAEEGASESADSSSSATSQPSTDEDASPSAGEGTAEREASVEEADEVEPPRRGTSKRSATEASEDEEESPTTKRVNVAEPEKSTETDEKPDKSPPAPAAALTMTTAAGAGRRESATVAAAPTYAPSSVTVGQGPAGVALGSDGTRAYVANSTGRSVSVVDTASGTVLKTIAVTGSASAVAVHGNRAYVTLRSTGKVAVIDTSTYTVVSSVSVGLSPSAIALNSTGTRIYVTNAGSGTMSVIDATTNKKIASVVLGASPAAVAVNPNDHWVYAAVKGSDRIAVVSATTNRVIANVAVGDSPRDVAVTPDGNRLYAVYGSGNVAVIDTTSNRVVVPSISVGPTPTALVAARDVPRVFVANSNDTVTEIDTLTNTVIQNILSAPTANSGDHDIAVSADGKRIYVSDFRDGALRLVGRVNSAPVLTAGPFVQKPDVITGMVYASIRVLDSDGDRLLHTTSQNPTFGGVVITQAAGPGYTSFSIVYTPTDAGRLQADDPGGVTTDSFTLRVSDPSGAALSVSFTVEIEPIHVTTSTTPIAVGDTPVGSVVSGRELYVVNGGAGTISVIDRVSKQVTHTLPIAGSIVASADGKFIYVAHGPADGASNTVTVIDTASKTLRDLARIPRGDADYNSGAALAVSPDGTRLYVANQADSLVSVVDTATGRIISTTDLGYWNGELAITPDGTRLYRTLHYDDVQVIDVTGTPKLIGRVDVMPNSSSFVAQTLMINPEGTRAYVLNGETQLGANGSISVIDIDPSSTSYNSEIDFGYVDWQDRIAIDFGRGKVYLSNYYSTSGRILDLDSLTVIGEFSPSGFLTADNGTLYVSDPSTDTVYAIDVVESAFRASVMAAADASATVGVGRNPSGVAVAGSVAYVANSAGRSVSVVDTATGSVLETIPVRGTASAVAVHEGRAYVALRSTGRVAVIDTATHQVVKTISTGWLPSSVAISPDGRRVYVGNTGSGTVSVIDTATNTKVAAVRVGWLPAGVTVSPDSARVYVAAAGSDRITVIDAANNSVSAVHAVGDAPTDVVVTRDGSRLYATYGGGKVAVIDTATHASTEIAVGAKPTALALSPTGSRLYVANSDDTVTVIDTVTNTVVGSLPVDSNPETGPHDILVSEDGTTLFVTDSRDGALRIVDTNAPPNRAPVVVGQTSWSAADWRTGRVTGWVMFSDPDMDRLSYGVTDGPARGTVTLEREGLQIRFTYQPTEAARHAAYASTGEDTDTFTIRANDGVATAEVPLTVIVAPQSPVNRAPELQGEPSMQVDLNTGRVSGSFTIDEPDRDFVGYSDVDPPQGHVSLFGSSGPATTYTYNFTFHPTDAARQAAAQTSGPDTASYGVTIDDGRGGVASFTIDLPVEPRPTDMPVWRGPTVETYDVFTGRTTGNINALDPDGDPLVYGTTSGPWYGTLTLDNATGDYVYVPLLNAENGWLSSEIVTVSVDDGTYVTYYDWWVQTFRNDVGPW